MSGNAQKTHYGLEINRFAERKVLSALQLVGKALPCSVVSAAGSIVTVKFELRNIPFTLPSVTVPTIFPQWIRVPFQPGDPGFVVPADASLAAVSGMADGAADLSIQANLSALAFVPVGSKKFSDAAEPRKIVLYGPDGAVLRDQGSKNKITVDKTVGITIDVTEGTFTVNVPTGHKVVVNGDAQVGNLDVLGNINLTGSFFGAGGVTYAADLKVGGDVFAGWGSGDQVGVQTHTHQYDRPSGASAPAQTVKPTAGT